MTKDLKQLGQWVAAQHGWPAAKAFKAWTLDESAGAILTRKALEILHVMPASLDRAALTCAYAVHLLRDWDAPVQVVAGQLCVEGDDAFGEALHLTDALAWDGAGRVNHLWIMMGSQVIDIALFREAYAPDGQAHLAKFVDLEFGPGKALYVDEWRLARRRGLSYEPTHILSSDQVDALLTSAHQALAR